MRELQDIWALISLSTPTHGERMTCVNKGDGQHSEPLIGFCEEDVVSLTKYAKSLGEAHSDQKFEIRRYRISEIIETFKGDASEH